MPGNNVLRKGDKLWKYIMTNTIDLLVVRGIKASGSSKILQVLNFMLKESIEKKKLHYITKPAVIIDPSLGK